jgi:5-(carboxyamino)imidazole ribonucleotide synthase
MVTVERLQSRIPMRPSPAVLRVAQDRILEKKFLNDAGVPTAPWRAVRNTQDFQSSPAAIGTPSILKTARFGYDGKGQRKIDNPADLAVAWDAFGGVECILEGFVAFEREISVIVARGADGALAHYDPVENEHRDHILAVTRVPARIAPSVALAAQDMANRIATRLDLVGLIAVEMFVTPDGRVLANEIAPRPHNSGHWTIEGASTDQFEQTIRAVCGLPLGSPRRRFDAVMENLIGADVERWRDLIGKPDAHLHLYGKSETRPGRKMGHVTWIKPRT